ncbi:MAG TPA: hypothetical protein V6D48_14345, partial [Oculatellaceae cyanobacterium]
RFRNKIKVFGRTTPKAIAFATSSDGSCHRRDRFSSLHRFSLHQARKSGVIYTLKTYTLNPNYVSKS